MQCDFRNSAGTKALVDAAVANATALSSGAASFTAYPCYRDIVSVFVFRVSMFSLKSFIETIFSDFQSTRRVSGNISGQAT